MDAPSVTGKDADRLNFKAPALRNIELTCPCFHDGAAETMTQAVDLMGRLQLQAASSTKTKTPRSWLSSKP